MTWPLLLWPMAIASPKSPSATRQFLQTLANDEHHVGEIREAARQTLQLMIGPAAKD